MSHNFNQSDRDILSYRPKIDFVEPEIESEVSSDFPEVESPETVQAKWDNIGDMAKAARILAEAFQARVDNKVGDFYVKLDTNIDRGVIDALSRKYPGTGTDRITYAQYKECREAMKDRGDQLAREISPDWNKVKSIRSGQNETDLGYFDIDNADAKNGTLYRPDLQELGKIVEPLNIDNMQEILLKQLMNTLWKKFIKPILAPLIPPPLNKSIPDEIA